MIVANRNDLVNGRVSLERIGMSIIPHLPNFDRSSLILFGCVLVKAVAPRNDQTSEQNANYYPVKVFHGRLSLGILSIISSSSLCGPFQGRSDTVGKSSYALLPFPESNLILPAPVTVSRGPASCPCRHIFHISWREYTLLSGSVQNYFEQTFHCV